MCKDKGLSIFNETPRRYGESPLGECSKRNHRNWKTGTSRRPLIQYLSEIYSMQLSVSPRVSYNYHVRPE